MNREIFIIPIATILLGAKATTAFAQTQELAIGQRFVTSSHGTKDSQIDPLQGHENESVVPILLPRSDGAVYSGLLNASAITFEGVNDVSVETWNVVANNTMNSVLYNGTSFNVTDTPIAACPSCHSIFFVVPFSGNAVLLHVSHPFFSDYAVSGIVNGGTQK